MKRWFFLLVLLGNTACTVSSSRALSPDREPAAPVRHSPAPDSAATPD